MSVSTDQVSGHPYATERPTQDKWVLTTRGSDPTFLPPERSRGTTERRECAKASLLTGDPVTLNPVEPSTPTTPRLLLLDHSRGVVVSVRVRRWAKGVGGVGCVVPPFHPPPQSSPGSPFPSLGATGG